MSGTMRPMRARSWWWPWVLSALLGCVHDSGGTVVELWAMGREGDIVVDLLPEFERRTPGVRVRVQQIPWSAAHEKLLTAYVGNTMPDLFQVGNTWIPEFVALGAIQPLDSRIAGSSTVRSDDYFPGILDTNVIDGRTFGIPWYVDTRLLFYRTDLLRRAGMAQPPTTWTAWVDVLTRIKTAAGPRAYAILLPLNEWQPPVILALQRGAALLRDDDRYGNFRSREFLEAFEFYLGLFQRDLAPRSGESQVGNLYQDFASGYFSQCITGPWNIGELARRLPANVADSWGTAPLPAPHGDYPGASVAGGASLAIFHGARHADAAWQLIEYLSEPAQQIAFYRLSGDLPARKTAWVEARLTEDQYAAAFWIQLQRLRAIPKIPEWERIADKITHYVEAAVRADLTAEAALTALDMDVDAILEKRRWMLQRGRAPSDS